MPSPPFVWPSRLRFVDTDASGRIHYTAMLRHFEAAEIEFLRLLGIHYTDTHTTGIGFPRVHVDCDYTGPVQHDDMLDITVRVGRVGNSSYTLAFDAAVDGQHVAHGRITIVCIDAATQRPRPLPEELASALRSQEKSQ